MSKVATAAAVHVLHCCCSRLTISDAKTENDAAADRCAAAAATNIADAPIDSEHILDLLLTQTPP